MEIVFLGCAVVGGGFFLLRSIAMLIGLGGDDYGLDTDVSDVHGEPVASFKMVTIHGLTAFLFMFGLVGYTLLRNDHTSLWFASLAAMGAGVLTMALIAKIFHASRKLSSDGTIHLKDAVGQSASVYLTIRPGSVGKVQVTVRDALKVFDARAKDATMEIKTGDAVKILEADDVLIVEPM